VFSVVHSLPPECPYWDVLLMCFASLAEAVPKRILELMSVQGLTRENVASHLQV
jgi:hypothetical protein